MPTDTKPWPIHQRRVSFDGLHFWAFLSPTATLEDVLAVRECFERWERHMIQEVQRGQGD